MVGANAKVPDYVPEQGDIVWLSFSPTLGHEQTGRRPALVMSPVSYNRKVGLALVCPITSKAKGYPFEVGLGEELDIVGVVLSDHVRNVDWRQRKAEFKAKCRTETLSRVSENIGLLLTVETNAPE